MSEHTPGSPEDLVHHLITSWPMEGPRFSEDEADLVAMDIIRGMRAKHIAKGYTPDTDDVLTHEELVLCSGYYAMPSEIGDIFKRGLPRAWQDLVVKEGGDASHVTFDHGNTDLLPADILEARIINVCHAAALLVAEAGRLIRVAEKFTRTQHTGVQCDADAT